MRKWLWTTFSLLCLSSIISLIIVMSNTSSEDNISTEERLSELRVKLSELALREDGQVHDEFNGSVFESPEKWTKFRSLNGFRFLSRKVVSESLSMYMRERQEESIKILEIAEKLGSDPFELGLKLTIFRLNKHTQSGIGNQLRKLHSAFTYALAYNHWFLIEFDYYHLLFDGPLPDVQMDYRVIERRYKLNSMIEKRRKSHGDVVSDFRRDDESFKGDKRYKTFQNAVCMEFTESGASYYGMLADSCEPNERLFKNLVLSLRDQSAREYALRNMSRSLWPLVYYSFSFLMQRPTMKYLHLVEESFHSVGMNVHVSEESRSVVRDNNLVIAIQYRFFMDVISKFFARKKTLTNFLAETKIVLDKLIIPGLQSRNITILYSTDYPYSFEKVREELGSYTDRIVMTKETKMIHSKDFYFSKEIPQPMLDWFMLGECDVLITAGTSFSLSAIQRKHLVPVYSLKEHGWFPKGQPLSGVGIEYSDHFW